MSNKTATAVSSFYYDVNMIKLLREINIITKEEAQKTIESLVRFYGLNDVFLLSSIKC